MANPTYIQLQYQFGADDGNDASYTLDATAGLNGPVTQGVGTANRLIARIQLDNANSRGGAGDTANWEYRINTGSWTAVAPTNAVRPYTTSGLTDGNDCTSRLAGGATHLTANSGQCETDGAFTVTVWTKDTGLETSLAYYINDGSVSDTDTVELRLTFTEGWSVSYSQTPSITVSIVAGTEYFQSVAGTLTSSGTLVKQTQKPLAGALTSAGTVVKQTAISLTGTLTSAGDLVKETAKSFAGTLTSSGVLGAVESGASFIAKLAWRNRHLKNANLRR